MKPVFTIILAAGHGTRMKSRLPKVFHLMGGKTLIEHVTNLACSVKSKKTVLVVPQKQDHFKKVFGSKSRFHFAVQKQQLGTGHALQAGLSGVTGAQGTVLVLNSDTPLVRGESIRQLLRWHQAGQNAVSFLTAHVKNPGSFGRITRHRDGQVSGIVEVKDASGDQIKINEINVGNYCFDLAFLKNSIRRLKSQNKQGEFYLTDLVAMAVAEDLPVQTHEIQDVRESLGVNTQSDLKIVNEAFYARQQEKFMADGVSIIGDAVFIDADVKIASGTHIESPCYLKGNTRLGEDVKIEMGCVIQSSRVASGVRIRAHSYLDEAVIAKDCLIGPFAHLRPGTVLMTGAKIGNFVETKKTRLGEGSKINHLSYIGDAVVGKKTNIGAGTITCNYDGYNKFKTVLGDGVFIGSDTQLVAPVKIGSGAFVGAGTTVTQDVSANSLAISRTPQKEIKNWARKKRQN